MTDVSGTRPQGIVWRRISFSLKPFRSATSGFTLLEVMVAVSIIAIVFVSVFRLHTQTLTMSGSVRFYATAPMLAQGKLAELENRSAESLSDDTGDFGEQFPGYSWEAGVSDVASEILEDTAKDLKRIDLAVSYEGLVYSLRTYRFLRPVKE